MSATAAAGADGLEAAILPAFAVGLALVHLFAGRLRFLDAIPRSRWLSLSGGVSIAYVFVHVLPEVAVAAETVDESGTVLAALEYHVYLVSLAGFVVFYGLERYVREAAPDRDSTDGGRVAEATGVFWLHTASFALYNALVGYLLVHREDPGLVGLTLFAVAMALHFLVNDFGLRDHHGRTYHRYGRWVLAAAVLAGVAVGFVTTVGELSIGVLFAFLAGGVVLNVIKEELPAERRSRFWAFAGGAAGYSILLVTI